MTGFRKIAVDYWPGIALFVLALAIGGCVYSDYGISWDEPIQRDMGMTSYKYVFHHDPYLLTFSDRSHGVAFELPLVLIEKWLHITDPRQLYLMRHLVTHLFFLISVFLGYLLCLRLFKDQFIASLGFIMLAFTPRIYAHSFVNTKDLPFISALIIFYLIVQIAFEKNKTGWYILAAIACAYASSIRAMGVMFALFTCFFFLTDIFSATVNKQPTRLRWMQLLLFVAVFCGFLYASWPILWTRPFFHFAEEFQALSHIYWAGFVLLNGVNVPGDRLPWYYVPEWVAITTPILWLISGIAGIVWCSVVFLKRPLALLTNTPYRNFLLYLASCLVPVAMVILLQSILYDDWRHLYFIYPSFVLLALYALHRLAAGRWRKLVIGLCAVQIAVIAWFMVRNHPYENIYFNELVSHRPGYLKTHFDLDYWGCSDKQGLDYILAHDPADTLLVWNSLYPVDNNRKMIPAGSRARIKLVDSASATYFLTNFRNHPDDYPYPQIYYEINVLNSPILRIYKMK